VIPYEQNPRTAAPSTTSAAATSWHATPGPFASPHTVSHRSAPGAAAGPWKRPERPTADSTSSTASDRPEAISVSTAAERHRTSSGTDAHPNAAANRANVYEPASGTAYAIGFRHASTCSAAIANPDQHTHAIAAAVAVAPEATDAQDSDLNHPKPD
jgi:hypothetical protein